MYSKSSHDQKKANINVVWLGSHLREKHANRAEDWDKFNPNYQICYYVDSEFFAAVCNQLVGTTINVKKIEEIHLQDNVKSLFTKLTEKRADNLLPNYAAATDVCRFNLDGWYFDIDINPFDVSKIEIDPQYNCLINASSPDKKKVHTLSISAFFMNREHPIAKKVQEYFTLLSNDITDDHIKLIRSTIASNRLHATFASTGFCLRGALGKISVKEQQAIISVLGLTRTENNINEIEVFNRISMMFGSDPEQTWILKDKTISTTEAIPGIVLDDNYINGNIPAEVTPISDLRKQVFDKMQITNLIEVLNSIYEKKLTFFCCLNNCEPQLTEEIKNIFSLYY